MLQKTLKTILSLGLMALPAFAADVKVSALTALTTPEHRDELIIVDKSDVSQAATGSTRKITLRNLIGNPTNGSILFADNGTLAQDNSTLFWDSTNKRLGLGTSTPSSLLTLNKTLFSTDGGADVVFSLVMVDQAVTANSTHYHLVQDLINPNINISAGVTDAGYRSALRVATKANSTVFAGTLTNIYNIISSYGMQVATPGAVITNAIGLLIDPQTGQAGTTITNLYGIKGGFSAAPTTTVTNCWGLYFTSELQNYLSGKLGIGTATLPAQLNVTSGTAGTIGSIIKGAAAQTANLQEWQNSSGTILSAVSSSGSIGIGTSTPISTLHVAGSLALAYVGKTATYTATASDYTINCTSGTFTVNLPAVSGITGRVYVIKNSGAGVITLDGNASETIDGAATQAIAATASMTIQSTGAGWIII